MGAVILIASLATGALIGLPGESLDILHQSCALVAGTTCLVSAVVLPFALFASAGRGYRLPTGVAVLVLITANLGDYRYLGTSPDQPHLIVAGDGVEDVLANAPGVALALLETMHEHGIPLPSLVEAPQPHQTRVLVSA
jgi:predicted RNase H-like HicB family nuclease